MHVTKGSPGTHHDLSIFRDSGATVFFTGSSWDEAILGDNTYVMCDRGYQGIQKLLRAVHPIRRSPRKQLSSAQQLYNKSISRKRIVIENWYGRMKVYWKILGSTYRGKLDFLDDIFTCCAALTNIMILKYPLKRNFSELPEEAPVHLGEICNDTEDWSISDVFEFSQR